VGILLSTNGLGADPTFIERLPLRRSLMHPRTALAAADMAPRKLEGPYASYSRERQIRDSHE